MLKGEERDLVQIVNVKTAARDIAMRSSQFSHALERRGDVNT
jgi:hypothetical protein